jgi:hypothetical protein
VSFEDVKAAWGRRVFFLNPHGVFTEQLFLEILEQEYEVYVLKGHDAAWRAAAAYPGSILFVNVDAVFQGGQWGAWIRKLREDEKTSSTMVGILTYNTDPELARIYLTEIEAPCGFILLKQGLIESKRILLKTLEANEARGRRKFVRARCPESVKAFFNVKYGAKLYTGRIHDISAAGMTYNFDKNLPLKSNEHLPDIQLKLKGVLCRVAGTFVAEVKEGTPRNLLMFDQPLPAETRGKIHRFIFHTLQENIALKLGTRQ